jgi:virginiamycin B lyase
MSNRYDADAFDHDGVPAANDPFAPDAVEATIATRLAPGAPGDDETLLVRELIEVYTLPREAEAAIERVRLTFNQSSAEPRNAMSTLSAEVPTAPGGIGGDRARAPFPRRQSGAIQTFLRSAVAVLIVALLAGAFYVVPRIRGTHPTPHATSTPLPSATPAPVTPTATVTPFGVITEYRVPGAWSGPWDITLGPDGALWFVEYSVHKIGRLTTDGHFAEYVIPSNPTKLQLQSITSGPDHALWFTETPTEGGQGITDSGVIGRITTGGHVTEFQLTTPNSQPVGITPGPDGALWFADCAGNEIGRITTGGQITEYALPLWQSNGGAVSNCPERITSGPDGALWFTERNSNKIGRITTDGHLSAYDIPTRGSGVQDITSGPDGALWFTESLLGRQIGRITTAGVITEYPLPDQETDVPGSIVSGPDGALWFTLGVDTNTPAISTVNKIGRLTPDGRFSAYPIPTLDSDPIAGGIAPSPDGALWFTEYLGNKIGRITA